MRAPSFSDFLHDTPAAVSHRASSSTLAAEPTSMVPLTKADLARINEALASFTKAAPRTAVAEVETRIAQRIDRNPVTVTR